MKRIIPRISTALAMFVVSCTVSSGERLLWSDGHGDLQVGYVNGSWEWGLGTNNAVDDIVVGLDNDAKALVPDNPNFDFLGTPGTPIWIIPQVDREGVIFMGINSSATAIGTFEDNRFDLRLASVSGPGDFVMWITGGTGSVDVPLDSQDGISSGDRISVPAPGHFHENWGFTSPGTYQIGFQGEGTLVGQAGPITSDEEIYRFAVNVFDRGELDLEVAYDQGEWELVLLDEATKKEIEAGDVALHVGPLARQIIPANPAFSFLGSPGESVYILPQVEQERVLFLGIAGDEIEPGVFSGGEVSLELSSVDGPGAVFLYSTDEFGGLTTYFDSADGIGVEDQFPIRVGSHSHQNWAFSEPGYYRIGLRASGVLIDGTATTSDEIEFLFEVFGPTVISEGELDLEVAYEDGEWEIVALDELNETEICADELVIQGSSGTMVNVPSDPSFGFLGAPGATINVLPQEESAGAIFLGIAGDEIPLGIFENNRVSLELVEVRGPGNVSLYSVDEFGKPSVFFNSGDGISSADVFPISVGGHSHQNWGFSAPGSYKVALRASGILVGGSEKVLSESVEFTFVIEANVLNLSMALRDDGALVLSWLTERGKRYQLESTIAINEKGWQAVGEVFLGNAQNMDYVIPSDDQGGASFFRLREWVIEEQ